MSQFYSDESRKTEKYALPDCEVFYRSTEQNIADGWLEEETHEPFPSGWYYWYCLPGCLPDGEAQGPFDSEQDAIDDCRDAYSD